MEKESFNGQMWNAVKENTTGHREAAGIVMQMSEGTECDSSSCMNVSSYSPHTKDTNYTSPTCQLRQKSGGQTNKN